MNERCENCRFWSSPDGTLGWCHRYPPKRIEHEPLANTTGWNGSAFPEADCADWCGEYQHRDNSE